MENLAYPSLVRSRLTRADIDRINANNQNLNLVQDKETGELVEVHVTVSENEAFTVHAHSSLSAYLYLDKAQLEGNEKAISDLSQKAGH